MNQKIQIKLRNGQTKLDEMAAKAFRVSSFTTVGHLLHINLKDHMLKHKLEIGEELLAKNPRALAVVNKLNTIDNSYRTFEFEIIAKRKDCDKTDEELMIVEINENKCRFQLDFSKVYWNSRLSSEHERIINRFNKSIDIVYDLFAGVGPFSVPAAKYKCKTFANDLNKESVKWLEINMRRNKAPNGMYHIFNKDAQDFIRENLKTSLLEQYEIIEVEELAIKPKIHILMNLPALAPSFLPHFIGLLKNEMDDTSINGLRLIDLFKKQNLEHIVYCYCFLKGNFEDPKSEVKEIIEENFFRELTDHQLIDISRVRNVAPYKEMYRVEIKLDDKILFDVKQSIMKGSASGLSTNGSKRKVSIKTSMGPKRPHEDDTETDEELDVNKPKKAKISEYCSLI